MIGIALLWQAIKDTDNPMEEWLKGCMYGNGPRRFTLKEEMDALNGLVYAMTVEVEWSGTPGNEDSLDVATQPPARATERAIIERVTLAINGGAISLEECMTATREAKEILL